MVVSAAVIVSVVIVVVVVVAVIVIAVIVVSVVVIFVLAVVMTVIVPVLFAHFVAVKLLFPAHMPSPVGPFTFVRIRAVVSEPWIISVIHIGVEALGAVEPWTRADEDPAREPLRPVITERRTTIWRIVEIAVGAGRGHSDGSYRDWCHRNRCVHSNIDAHLRR